ncbi:MAG: ankyrin repeat domain-containing protein, partial [Gemmatimonadaceae bacterium]
MTTILLAFVAGAFWMEPAPVADAAMRRDLPAVRALIAAKADVNVPQGDGMTALHWAAEAGDSAMTAILLRAKANVRALTRIGDYTPLHIASRTGNGAVVQALLNAGSNARALTATGATALHFAAASGNAAAISALIARGADVNAREVEWGQTPLIFAAASGRADAIHALVQAGADPNVHTSVMNLTEAAAVEQAATRRRNEVLVSFEPERHRDSLTVRTQSATGTGAAAPGALAAPATAAAPARAAAPQPKGPFTAAQIQAAIDSGRVVYASAASARGPVQEEVDTINGGVPGFAASVGGVGGLTALHHPVRQGNSAAAIA